MVATRSKTRASRRYENVPLATRAADHNRRTRAIYKSRAQAAEKTSQVPARRSKSVRSSARTQTQEVSGPSTTTTPATRSTRVLRSTTVSSPSPPQSIPSPKDKSTRKTRKRRNRDYWGPKRKPKTPAKPRPPPPTHYTCRICVEELPVADFPRYVPPRHRHRLLPTDVPSGCIPHLTRAPGSKRDPVCKTCIGKNMAARHDLLGARSVSTGCVEPECYTHWNTDLVVQYFPAGEPLEKYNLDMMEVYLHTRLESFLTCVNPSCGARALVEREFPGWPQVECTSPTCATRFCVKCLVPWHTGLTCTEYAARHINDKMSDPDKQVLDLMQAKDGKRCPNCYLVIEKDGGCNSMRCPGCEKYFDWLTAASAVPGSNKAAPVDLYGDARSEWFAEVCEADRKEVK